MLDRAAFRIVGAEIEPADSRQSDRRGAHRARLERDVEIAFEAARPEGRAACPQYQHLGMRRRSSSASTRCRPRPTLGLRPSTSTAPTGTSPRAAAASPSARASFIGCGVIHVPAANGLGDRDRPPGREAHEQAFLLGLGMKGAVDQEFGGESPARPGKYGDPHAAEASGSAMVTGRRMAHSSGQQDWRDVLGERPYQRIRLVQKAEPQIL